MTRLDGAAELGAHGAFVADHVRPGAAQAGRADGFMGVDHDVVLGRLDDGIVVMVDDRLAVVILAVRDDLADVAALDGVVAILVHEVVGLLHPALVINGGRGTFMVHDQAHALAVGIGVKGRQVEVRIRGDEVEDVVFLLAVPVFPAFVPAFDQQAVEAVLGGEVDVAADILVVGAVLAVRGGMGIVRDAQLDGRIVIGIGPLALAGDHFPPDTHVFDWVDPGNVVQGARVIEVEDQAGSQHVGGFFADHDGAPRGLAGGLHPAFHAFGVRGQGGAEDEVAVVHVQARGRVVEHGGFMDIDVEAFGGLHLQGGLDGRRGDAGVGPAAVQAGFAGELADLGEFGFGRGEFLGGIVAGDPPGGVVAGHGEFRDLVLDHEVGQAVFQREFITESEAVVIQAETHLHDFALAVLVARVADRFAFEGNQHFVVVVANLRFLAPDRFPGLVEGVVLGARQREPVRQVGAAFI